MTRTTILGVLTAMALAGCGREVTPSDVKLLNVGNDPDQIGPSPTPYGGIVDYNHVDIAGGALPLGVMGLRGYTEIGPDLVSMAPPYEAVFALSYLFDTKLRGATNLSLVLPHPPAAVGTCYTQIQPSGPFDSSFNTVDVGDWMDFRRADDDKRVVRLERIPRDYPPEASRLSVYYQALEGFSPTDRTHLVPAADGSLDPRDMVEVPYRFANFPFGDDLTLQFPGGFTSFDKPVASIPRPSASIDPTILRMPQPVGGVQLQWDGPKWTYSLAERTWERTEGTVNTCFEFVDRNAFGGGEPGSPSDCNELTPYPNGEFTYNIFRGQMYTGPWDATDGQVTMSWEPDESEDTIVVAVKFLAGVDPQDDAFVYRAVEQGGEYRDARVCESGEYVFDDEAYGDGDDVPYAEDGEVSVALQGNPSEVLSQVVCSVPNDGSFSLTQDVLAEAMEYAVDRGGSGAIFLFGRDSTVEASIPAVKDPYDQIHDVNPVKVSARTVRVGRFYWDPATAGSVATGGEE